MLRDGQCARSLKAEAKAAKTTAAAKLDEDKSALSMIEPLGQLLTGAQEVTRYKTAGFVGTVAKVFIHLCSSIRSVTWGRNWHRAASAELQKLHCCCASGLSGRCAMRAMDAGHRVLRQS